MVKQTNGLWRTDDGGRQPLVLAFDTSTAALAAALVRGGEVLQEVQYMAERNHSVQIVPKLKTMLAEAGVSAQQLDGIAVGKGPGSYTGMRIAASVAKTLAWVWGTPLAGVSSLEAIAYGAWHSASGFSREASGAPNGAGGPGYQGSGAPKSADGPDREALGSQMSADVPAVPASTGGGPTDWVIPLMDARRGQVYTGGFTLRPDGTIGRWAEDGVRLMKEWTASLLERAVQAAGSDAAPARIWLAGDLSKHMEAAEGLAAAAQDAFGTSGPGPRVKLYPYELEGRWIAWLGMKRIIGGETDDAHTFVPNYTQLAEAEAKLVGKIREA